MGDEKRRVEGHAQGRDRGRLLMGLEPGEATLFGSLHFGTLTLDAI